MSTKRQNQVKEIPQSSFTLAPKMLLQRQCACGQHTGGGECSECRKKREGMMQRAAVSSAPVNTVPSIVHNVLSSPGQPLDANTRAFMGPRFNHDFSQVRVHTDAKAAESVRAVNALAYTVGRDVVFGTGQYTPGTSEGRRLLAHELTHVVQQRGHTPKSIDSISSPASASEQGATSIGERIEQNILKQPQVAVQVSSYPQGSLQRQADAGVPSDTILDAGTLPGGVPGSPEAGTTPDAGVPTDAGVSSSTTPEPAAAPSETCNCQLCFLPLEVFLNMGIPPEEAYLAAVHAYIKWNGHSAGFTRLDRESIGEARVISPEPRLGEPHERCVPAKLRTIPLPTGPQLVHFVLSSSPGSYPVDVVNSLLHCQGANCALTRMRLQHLLLDDRRGLYNLIDDNCETWARNVLSAACLEADSVPQGGYGNFAVRVFQETGVRELYHLGRLILGRTRPMPNP